jgi:hypothetical protein
MLLLLVQGFPPIPVSENFDLSWLLLNMAMAVVWALVAAVCFGVVVAIGFRVLDALTPGLDKMEELRKGNVAVAAVMATFMLCLTAVVVAVLLG